MYPFRRTCKQAAALIVAREDRELGLADRAGLRLHLGICKGCTGFDQQMGHLRGALARWRHYQEPADVDVGTASPPQNVQKS